MCLLGLSSLLVDATDTVYREAWRYTGPFTRFNRFKGAFPGLGIATVAFAGYLVLEQVGVFGKEEHHGAGGHGHAEPGVPGKKGQGGAEGLNL